MQPPSTVSECLPQLRLFAEAMCGDREVGDRLVAKCLVEARTRRSLSLQKENLLFGLLTVLAELIGRQGPVSHASTMSARSDTMSLIRQLPPYHRDVLITVTVFGLRYWEAAAICKCPIGTIKSRLNRAKASLAASLAEQPSSAVIKMPPGMRELAAQPQ
ncbi:hypothetical protein D4A92_23590 (plasmid) [Rhizobium rosettiformans]|uniref:RNA polymerase sigma factor 70 region 4 type 2 domain-containing protein n=1 Tax=Rhizobium rosettiformans TaxID=1368430 RepID=A0ABX7F201_9HYPH|nr:sigma factor-like helix-turn-helix DNA-binding protein [Rhizobium rosettiformans]QRF54489.1 hypothetical protein D4A92_23590 [Rhizobium rosettiformans]